MGNNLWPSHLAPKVLGLYLSSFLVDRLSLGINWVYCLLHIIHQKQAMRKSLSICKTYIHQGNRSKVTGNPLHSVHICHLQEKVLSLAIWLNARGVKCKRCQRQYIGMISRALYFHLMPSTTDAFPQWCDNKIINNGSYTSSQWWHVNGGVTVRQSQQIWGWSG